MRYLGARFCPGADGSGCIGSAGLGQDHPTWTDIRLNDPAHQAAAARRGWAIKGDMEGEAADHKVCYEHPGNWPLIQA